MPPTDAPTDSQRDIHTHAFLARFVAAQAGAYADALAEMVRGQKRTHWMWFIFPQIAGLGHSATAQYYAIPSLRMAQAYLAHKVLGARYRSCVAVLADSAVADPRVMFGAIDAMKLRSSLTLFEAAAPEPLFAAPLDRWFDGARDAATERLLHR